MLVTSKWTAPYENVSSDICEQRRPRSACAYAQSDQGIHFPLTELLDTTECMNGEQMLECHFEHAQGDVNMHFAHGRRHFFAWSGPNNIVALRFFLLSLRKQAYSSILKILQPKNWKFSDKNSDIFLISAQKHRLWVLVRTASPRRF